MWQSALRHPGLLFAAVLVAASSAAIEPAPPEEGSLVERSNPAFRVEPSLERVDSLSTRALASAPLADFFVAYGSQWELRIDTRSDRPHLLQGSGIALLPGRGNELRSDDIGVASGEALTLERVGALSLELVGSLDELLGTEGLDLRLDPSRSLSYGTDQYLWMIELQQFHRGVPVEGANVFLRINNGNVVQLGADRVAEVRIDTEPTVPWLRAWRQALRSLGIPRAEISKIGERGTLKIFPVLPAGESENEHYQGPAGLGYDHVLAWEFGFERKGSGYRLVVDAHTGEIHEYVDLTRYATVQGKVYPVTNTDPLVDVGFPSCSVTNSGTKVTDANGSYSYSGGTATSTLNGRYIRISDGCGAISLSNSSTGNLDFGGGGGTDCTTPGVGGAGNTHSARTGFYHLTRINRKAASFLSGNTWLNGTLTANMNINNTCNAFWNGSTVNFYRSGGGCSNTGEIAAVFLHEWGHGMDTNSGGAASDNGSGEAVGDTFAFLELEDGCIGENFRPGVPCANCRSSCTGVRDIEAFAVGGISTIAKPANVTSNSGINCDRWSCPYTTPTGAAYRGPMGYEGHCESYIASTANWDLAQELIAEYGTTAGWAAMDAIWYGSLTPSKSAYRVASGGTCNPSATVDGCGSTNWYTVYLSVDDDDGNLANGTPNGCRIWDAFSAHGIACGSRPACSTGGGGGGPTALTKGVPVTGIAGSTGDQKFYTLGVPAGATNLSFQISGGSGDADLYVRFGSAPTTSTYDCRPFLTGNNESCDFPSPSAGTWHVLLNAYSTYSGVSLVGDYTAGGGGPTTVTFTSVGAEDGRTWESTETSNTGGGSSATDNTTSSIRVGDLTSDRQYRSILSFDTSSIPDGATVTAATLRLKRGTSSGTNPFTTHGSCVADISSAFGGSTAFATSDFQASATATSVATMSNPTANGSWSTGSLSAAGLAAINKTGRTQLRVRFTLDDNDDNGYDYIGFYAGEAATGNKPELVVTYQN